MNLPPDEATTVFTVTLVLLIVSTIFTALRLISKWGVTKKSSPDDWLVVLSWLFTLALCVSILFGTSVGLGKTDADIRAEWEDPLQRSIYAFTIFYNPCLMATKSAILLLYIRLSTSHKFLRYATFVTLAVVNIAGVVLTFLSIFQCRPIAAAFTLEQGTCIDIVALYLSSAPITILTDLAILLLPLPILTSLRIEFRQKVVLVATFVVGGFVTVVDVIRIIYLQNGLEDERRVDPGHHVSASARPPDFIYQTSFTLMWSAVEVNVGLVCACVLVLRPLVMKVVPSLLHQSHQTQTQTLQNAPGELKELRSPPLSPLSPVRRLRTISEHESTSNEEHDGASEDNDSIEAATGPMDFMEMLATDAAPPLSPSVPPQSPRRFSKRPIFIHLGRSSTISEEPAVIQQPTQTFFDFVELGGRKPLTTLIAREAWWPVLFVSTLFFLWGFAYGLLGTLNGDIQVLLNYSPSRSIALHDAYWLAYFFSPLLFGYWTLTRSSFKSTFIAGLCVYSCGALSFWPSAVLLSYPGFFISNFIIALGLSCLEVAGNPFIALAGPSHLSEARLNFSQGIQAVGSVFSPILAKKVMFRNVSQTSLFNVQWCYLAVSLFVVALAVVFYYVPLSEATDETLETSARENLQDAGLDRNAKLPIASVRLRAGFVLLGVGTVAMCFYVGAQEAISYYWDTVIDTMGTSTDPFWDQAIAHAAFAIGRFLASFIAYLGVPPRLILLVCLCGAFITCLLALVLPPSSGALGMFILVSFFDAPIFPTLFAITIRNQGHHTKLASSVLVSAISGGAIWPTVSYGVERARPSSGRLPLIVPVVLYGVSILMPAWLCGGMRKWVDPVKPPSHRGSEEGRRASLTASSWSGKGELVHLEDTGISSVS